MPFKLPYRKEKEAFLVEISLQSPRQLFNTLDPSPFHEKDLDPAAERYLIDAVEELPLDEAVRLVVHLPEESITDNVGEHFQTAIHNYFSYRAMTTLHALRRCFREGRVALMVGLVFLVSCSLLRELALVYGDGFSNEMLAEGLLILGWVALWRPADILLYDWWPLLRRYRLLSKISRLTVDVRPSVVRTF
jgi:Mg/Co/Ni transporter MgtE